MKDEIKEILDRLEKIGFYASVPKELAYITTNITPQECKQLLDYITNLQEEVKFTEDYKDAYETTMIANKMLEEKYINYKSRIDKAVDYINHAQNYAKEKNVYVNGDNLLNILQGVGKDE